MSFFVPRDPPKTCRDIREISWKFPGNLDRDGEGPSVQKWYCDTTTENFWHDLHEMNLMIILDSSDEYAYLRNDKY